MSGFWMESSREGHHYIRSVGLFNALGPLDQRVSALERHLSGQA